jgi:hypothetical protein
MGRGKFGLSWIARSSFGTASSKRRLRKYAPPITLKTVPNRPRGLSRNEASACSIAMSGRPAQLLRKPLIYQPRAKYQSAPYAGGGTHARGGRKPGELPGGRREPKSPEATGVAPRRQEPSRHGRRRGSAPRAETCGRGGLRPGVSFSGSIRSALQAGGSESCRVLGIDRVMRRSVTSRRVEPCRFAARPAPREIRTRGNLICEPPRRPARSIPQNVAEQPRPCCTRHEASRVVRVLGTP